MLQSTDFVREFPVITRTDRDVEIPVLTEFIEQAKPESLLDVGAHWSFNYYAQQIRRFIKTYDAVDILDDPETRKVIDNYHVGNVHDVALDTYDTVICVSTIEHAGLTTYHADDVEKEQQKLFERCVMLAKKRAWFSFPTGLPYVYPGQLSVITEKQLTKWEKQMSNYTVRFRFFHNQAGPQFDTPWHEHTKREAATKQQYWDYCGNQAITVMEVIKE